MLPVDRRTEQALLGVLDETIQALTVADAKRLEALRVQAEALPKLQVASGGDQFDQLLAKKQMLEIILRNCESNINVLSRLHQRNTRDQWAL